MFEYMLCFLLGMFASVLSIAIAFKSKRMITAILLSLVFMPGLSILLYVVAGSEYENCYFVGFFFNMLLVASVVWLPMELKESVEERHREWVAEMEKKYKDSEEDSEEESEEESEEASEEKSEKSLDETFKEFE